MSARGLFAAGAGSTATLTLTDNPVDATIAEDASLPTALREPHALWRALTMVREGRPAVVVASPAWLGKAEDVEVKVELSFRRTILPDARLERIRHALVGAAAAGAFGSATKSVSGVLTPESGPVPTGKKIFTLEEEDEDAGDEP